METIQQVLSVIDDAIVSLRLETALEILMSYFGYSQEEGQIQLEYRIDALNHRMYKEGY